MRFVVVQAVGLISNRVIGIAGAESQQNIPFIYLLPFADIYGIYQFGDGCLDFCFSATGRITPLPCTEMST